MKKITNPRHLAVITLTRLDETEGFLREVLDFYLQQNNLSNLDRGLYTELVYGTVRMCRNLDYVLASFSKRPLKKIKPNILNNLRMGAYQILYLDKIPFSAAVNEGVKLARLFGHEGVVKFTNALLRQVARNKGEIEYPSLEMDEVLHIGVKYSFPDWIIRLWLKRWGVKETIELCQAMNEAPKMHLRVNTLKRKPQQIVDYLKELNVETEAGQYVPEVLQVGSAHKVIESSGLQKGMFYIQDESSALVAHALQVKPGQTVFDLCSAPGGKTTHIAELMQNKGKIIAVDPDTKRLQLVEENAKRLGISIIQTKQGDATKDLALPQADRVLVDAPCSGLGTMRHRPDIRWRKSLDEINQLVKIQKQILTQAANYVAKDGLLVYSTCTITEQENEEVAQWFLDNNKDFISYELPEWFPQGHSTWYRTILPQRHGVDGFFIAIFRKHKLG